MDSNPVIWPPCDVTERAVAQIAQLGGSVRVDLADGGCCGSTFVFDTHPDEPGSAAGAAQVDDDGWFGCPGAWLVVSSRAQRVLVGARLDFGAALKPPRFTVQRLDAEHRCPCGRSFGRRWPGPGQPTCRSYEPMPWDDEFEPPLRWRRQTGFDSR